jgi:hypothetical protein
MLRHLVSTAMLAFALALSPAWADPAGEFVTARTLFKQASEKGEGVKPALRAFEALSATPSPHGPLYLAYLGAARSIEGRDAWMPWNKLKLTERGLDTLDKALKGLEPRHDQVMMEGNPVSIEVRLVAVSTFFAVPDLFKRSDQARKILREAMASPAFPAAAAEVRARLYRQSAAIAGREGRREDEAAYLQKLLEALPTGHLADEARRRLSEMR